MDLRRLARRAWLASLLCFASLSCAGTSQAATFAEFVDPHPATGNQFGATVVPLSTGNVVITSPYDDAGGTDAGAVYLFNGATGALISTLLGAASSRIGSAGVTALSNGNYVIASPYWDDGAIADVGAATWGSGTAGVSGVVSAANSLVGSTAVDHVGWSVTALANGNYLVVSTSWDNGAASNAGAVTWGSGTAGVAGVVSAGNSLVGSTAGDLVGSVTLLTNGNYVVRSTQWSDGATAAVGAVTWGSGTAGVAGVVSAGNSLVGSTAYDDVGMGVTALANGNYVVASRYWDNGAATDVGAVTWCNGATGLTGSVSVTNSLVGSTASDGVGVNVTALSNGNYVVGSPGWSDGATAGVGAATWCNGATGLTGVVSAANSLIGFAASDGVGAGVTALSNGNYVVESPNWDDGAIVNVSAATWASGTTGLTGVVSAANSLIGSTAGDGLFMGVTALSNGNYLVVSTRWDNGAATDAGAVTWGSGTAGVAGVVSAGNSLVGSTAGDLASSVVMALANGNYVVASRYWDNGAAADVGAVTWGSGTSGVTGVVSIANSLVGSTAYDQVGLSVTPLANGNYVVSSRFWDNGSVTEAGAATLGSGLTGVSGAVSAANSLVGTTANDYVGGSVTALTNGNYVVSSTGWDLGVMANVGAVTWGNGLTGVSGAVSTANSLVGSMANDGVGSVRALSNGDYVVMSPNWDNGLASNAGAVTWGSGAIGVTGTIPAAYSLVGSASNSGMQAVVLDDVNGRFIARFLTEDGGRVRVGSQNGFVLSILSVLDIPNDQGGWLRLTFSRVAADVPGGSSPVTTYGVWRRIPGAISEDPGKANPVVAREPRADEPIVGALQAAVSSGLDVQEVEGRFFVVSGPSPAGTTSALPPGTWELVASVPALQQAQYVVAVPTLSNAAVTELVVTAHTTTPSVWYVSDPASGQSVDNLAPAQPAGFTAAYASGQTNLQWTANGESDLGSYRLYRGASADFTPAAGNRIASPLSTSYADVGPAGGYYKLSAVDVNGNESAFALVTPAGTTGVGGERPIVFALEGARPNPARGARVAVAFTLPTGAAGRLELLDVSGRQVLAREVGSLGAGRHTVDLAQGRSVAPGLYWVRLTQEPNRRTARVVVIE